MSQSDRPFFGGEADNLGIVHALPIKSFREFVERKMNIAVTLNVSREVYNKMDKRERSKAKRVPYVVPCSFQNTPSRRVYEEATTFSLICLDIDDPDHARPYYNNPASVQEALLPFNLAMYSTASSTPESPKLRLIVEAAGLKGDHYRKAVDFIANSIGLASVTTESYTLVQPMFLPTIFKGDDEETDHPLLCYEVESRPVTLADINTPFNKPLAPARKAELEVDDPTGSALDFLRPPVDAVTLPIAKAALKHLDPDMSYPEWFSIAASLRHQFTGKQAEPAYAAFDEWSAKGSKYAGSEDTRSKWDSVRPTPINRVPVTIRSILVKATAAGWSNVQVREACYKDVQKWIKDPARKVDELMEHGVAKILTAPMLSLAEEEVLLNALCDTMRVDFKTKVSVATLRKEMKLIKAKLNEKEEKSRPREVPPWAKGICYITSINKFFRSQTRELFAPEELDNAYGRKLLPTEEQIAAAAASGNLGALNPAKPTMRPRDYLLNMVKIPIVYDSVYDPRYPSDTFLELNGRAVVNLYTPNYPEPALDEAPKASGLFLKHLYNLVKEPDYRQTIIDYLAYMVQFPGRKVRWAMLIQGVEGCGKTFIAKALDAVLGMGHVRTIDSSALNSQWNDWAYGAQVIVLEEIRVTGHSRHDAMNALKPLITNDHINLNQRHRDSRQTDNTSNYIAFTNHHDPIVVTEGDRRYFIIKSAMQSKVQVLKLGPTYFRELFGMLDTHAAGLRHWLENWPISPGFDANGHAPRTKYLYEMLEDGTGDHALRIRDAIMDGVNPLVGSALVSSNVLLAHLVNSATATKYQPPSAQQLASILRELGFTNYGRFMVNGCRHYLWAPPTGLVDQSNIARVAKEREDEWERLDPDDLALL